MELPLKVFKDVFRERFRFIWSLFYYLFACSWSMTRWGHASGLKKIAITNFFLVKVWRGVSVDPGQRLQTAYSTFSELQNIWVTVRSNRQCICIENVQRITKSSLFYQSFTCILIPVLDLEDGIYLSIVNICNT